MAGSDLPAPPFYIGLIFCAVLHFPLYRAKMNDHTSSGRSAVLPVSQVSGLTLIYPGNTLRLV